LITLSGVSRAGRQLRDRPDAQSLDRTYSSAFS
jgi:hypothetical protein